MRVEDGFKQIPYQEPHPYDDDCVLPSLLRRLIKAKDASQFIREDLSRFGARVSTEIREISRNASPPALKQYDQWGQRIDILTTSDSWQKLKAIAQSEGIVGIFYEREFGEYSRVYGFAKVLLLAGDGQVIGCPLSMTDGTARVLELSRAPAMSDVLRRLTSRDPLTAMTAGQWMTERPGGSDVSRTETTAALHSGLSGQRGSTYRLNGFKWFSSATDSEVAVALARTGHVDQGTRSLSLFLVPMRLPLLRPPSSPAPTAISNGILTHRLKEKIGTHILPTAELSLNNTEGYLISPLNQGLKAIAPVLNITRIHSAVTSVGYLRRCLAIAQSYSKVRAIQGGRVLLRDVPLHVGELAKISLIYRALTHLVFGVVHLLGKSECGVATAGEEKRLRMLTPVVKAFAAEKACAAMEECMACLGGQGYMEENDIGRLIRDGLVEKIWEGTISVLSLDFIRAARQEFSFKAYSEWANKTMSSCPSELGFEHQINTLRTALALTETALAPASATLLARPTLMLFANVAAALYLMEQAVWSYKNDERSYETDALALVRWVDEGGMSAVMQELKEGRYAKSDRPNLDSLFVYGSNRSTARL